MKRLQPVGLIVLASLLLSACQTTTAQKDQCLTQDFKNWVKGAQSCFAIETFLSANKDTSVLVITLHGDLSSGGAADYTFDIAKEAAAKGAVGISMMRPGYTGGQKTSSGTATRRQDRNQRYNLSEVDDIGVAVAALKRHYRASKVIMVGHSGGAVISGVLAGRAAPLVDGLVLIGCPCDVPTWRDRNGWGPYLGAASPHEYVDKLPASIQITALTGASDSNTSSYLSEGYVNDVRKRGINAVFIEIPGAGHNYRTATMGSYVLEALDNKIHD